MISSGTHFVRVELKDVTTGKVLAQRADFVTSLAPTPVAEAVRPFAPFRTLFDVDVPDVLTGKEPSLTVNYDVKTQPLKRKMRIVIVVDPPLG